MDAMPAFDSSAMRAEYAQVQADKVGHFKAGFLIASTVQAATDSPTLGLLAGVAAGLAKEAYDKRNPASHTVDARDFLVTALGSATVYVGGRKGLLFYKPTENVLYYVQAF